MPHPDSPIYSTLYWGIFYTFPHFPHIPFLAQNTINPDYQILNQINRFWHAYCDII